MNRFRKLVPAVAIAAIALGVIGGTASAKGGGYGGGAEVPGVLEAEGSGIAGAGGTLVLEICATDGVLLVKGGVDIPEDAYDDEIAWLGLHVYFGFHGCATIGGEGDETSVFGAGHGNRNRNSGRKVAALGLGDGLQLRAAGNGIAFLKGEGTWEMDAGETGEWSEDGAIIKIGGRSTNCPTEAMHNGGGNSNKHKKCSTPTAEPSEEPTEEPTETPTEEP